MTTVTGDQPGTTDHFCTTPSAFVPILRHVAAPAQGLKSRLDLYCHEPPLDLVIPLFLIKQLTAGTQFRHRSALLLVVVVVDFYFTSPIAQA